MKKLLPMIGISVFLISITLMCISSAQAAAETKYIYFNFEGDTGRYSIITIEDNLYYTSMLFQGKLPENEDYTLDFYDGSDNLILEGKAYLGENNYYPFDDKITRIVLKKDDSIISDSQVSFCDSDSVCEPCYGYGCATVENSLTCPDCQTGGSDLYCDLANDGYCDPDCDNHDKDCPGCAENCWYSDSTIPMTACSKDKAGTICEPGQRCTGSYVYADDSGSLCCTKGKCAGGTASESGTDIPLKDKVPGVISSLGDIPDPEVNQSSSRFIPLAIAVILVVAALIFFVSWKNTP